MFDEKPISRSLMHFVVEKFGIKLSVEQQESLSPENIIPSFEEFQKPKVALHERQRSDPAPNILSRRFLKYSHFDDRSPIKGGLEKRKLKEKL